MKLYVNNFTYDTSIVELQALFETVGPVASVDLPRVAGSGLSRGMAFVEMADPQDIARAISQLDGCTWKGRRLFVTLANQTR
jgi:RNA recognition motif-containing protein